MPKTWRSNSACCASSSVSARTGDLKAGIGIEGHDQPPAELRAVMVDHGDREMAEDLAEIGLRIEHAVEDGATTIRPMTPRSPSTRRISPMRRSEMPVTARGAAERLPRQPGAGFARAIAASRHQARPPKSRAPIRPGWRRPGGIGDRRSARRLVKQDLLYQRSGSIEPQPWAKAHHRRSSESRRRHSRRPASR